ncbi:MAG: ABC transporter permease [Chitinophagales bacterium]
MLNSYFKMAIRNLWKHGAFSFINITGLAIGMSASFLIGIYLHFEMNYDRFHANANRIYRLACDTKSTSGINLGALTSVPMILSLKTDFPEIETATCLMPGNLLLRKGNIKFQETNALAVDSDFFNVFDFPMAKGNPHTALKKSPSIVLSESTAKKYFGSSNPLGQQIFVSQNNWAATVTGVMKNIPENSQIRADLLFYAGNNDSLNNDFSQWKDLQFISYVLLKQGVNEKALESRLPAFLDHHIGREMKRNNEFLSLYLEPLKDVYLYSHRGGMVSGNINNIRIFSAIALFILLIAAFNFINLSTARAAERAKEVGIRKMAGAARRQLITQFIGESVMICLMAFILSVLFSIMLLPLFNQLTGKIICENIFQQTNALSAWFILALGIGLFAGAYPAFILSNYKPARVLKGHFPAGSKGIVLREGLVITQFSISICLIIATFVIYAQLHYMLNQYLGFNPEQTLVIDTRTDDHGFAFKRELASIPGVQSSSFSSGIPGETARKRLYLQVENNTGDLQSAEAEVYTVDFDFLKQYQIKTIAGRSFSSDFATDSADALMLNETAVKTLGYASPEQVIGKRFILFGKTGKIIGVIRDFHFQSLQAPIMPLAMHIQPEDHDEFISIRIFTRHLPATLSAIEKTWTRLIPYRPFSGFFMDEFFDRQYHAENRFVNMVFNFSILAIFISCLGLFALASYSNFQRTKEIGIRKVLGASVYRIVNILSKDFLKLVVISFIIACPVSWYAMHRWLQDFAYRINILVWVFLLAGLTALLIASITISFQVLRATAVNPVKSLRSE